MAQPTTLVVDRLALRLAGVTPQDARRIALAVAEGLLDVATGAAVATMDQLRIDVTRSEGEGAEALAQRIVAEIARHLTEEP